MSFEIANTDISNYLVNFPNFDQVNNTILVTIQKGADCFQLNSDELNSLIRPFWYELSRPFWNKLSAVVKTAISSLLEKRDFLGQQLNYELGNITEDQFNIIAEKYLISKPIDIETLANDTNLLMKITSIPFDADQISVMFNCELDVAEKALRKIVNE